MMDQNNLKTPQKGCTPSPRRSSLSGSLSTTKQKIKRVSFAGDEELCKVNEYDKDVVTSSGTKLGRGPYKADRRESLAFGRTEIQQLSTIQENDDLRSSEGEPEVGGKGVSSDNLGGSEVDRQIKRRSFGVNPVWDEGMADVENISMGATPDSEFLRNRQSLDNRFSIIPTIAFRQSFPPKDTLHHHIQNNQQKTELTPITGYTEEAIEKAIQEHKISGLIPGGAKIPRTPEVKTASKTQPLQEIQQQRNETVNLFGTQSQKEDDVKNDNKLINYDQPQNDNASSPMFFSEQKERAQSNINNQFQCKNQTENYQQNENNVNINQSLFFNDTFQQQQQQKQDEKQFNQEDNVPMDYEENSPVSSKNFKQTNQNNIFKDQLQHQYQQSSNTLQQQYNIKEKGESSEVIQQSEAVQQKNLFNTDFQFNQSRQKNRLMQINNSEICSMELDTEENCDQNHHTEQKINENNQLMEICGQNYSQNNIDVNNNLNDGIFLNLNQQEFNDKDQNVNFQNQYKEYKINENNQSMEICGQNNSQNDADVNNSQNDIVFRSFQQQDYNDKDGNNIYYDQRRNSPFPGGLKLKRTPPDNNGNLWGLKPRKLSEEFLDNRNEQEENEDAVPVPHQETNQSVQQNTEVIPETNILQQQQQLQQQSVQESNLFLQSFKDTQQSNLLPIDENIIYTNSVPAENTQNEQQQQYPDIQMISQAAQTPSKYEQEDNAQQTQSISTPMQHQRGSWMYSAGKRGDRMGGSILRSENRGVQTSPRKPIFSPARNITLQQFFNKLQIPYLPVIPRCSSVLRPDTINLDNNPSTLSEHLRMTHLTAVEQDVYLGCTSIISKNITEKKAELGDKERQLATNNPALFQQVWQCEGDQVSQLSGLLSKLQESFSLSDQASWCNWQADTQEHLNNKLKQSLLSLEARNDAVKRCKEELEKSEIVVQRYVEGMEKRQKEFQRRQQVKKLMEQRQLLAKKRDQLKIQFQDSQLKTKNIQELLNSSLQQKGQLEQQREILQNKFDDKMNKLENPDQFTPLLIKSNQIITLLNELGLDAGRISKNKQSGIYSWTGNMAGCFRINLEISSQKTVRGSLNLLQQREFSWRITDQYYGVLCNLYGDGYQFQINQGNFGKLQQQLRQWMTITSSAKDLVEQLTTIRLKSPRMSYGPIFKEMKKNSIQVQFEFLNKNQGCLLRVITKMDNTWPQSYIHVYFKPLIDRFGKLQKLNIKYSEVQYANFSDMAQNINKIIDQI